MRAECTLTDFRLSGLSNLAVVVGCGSATATTAEGLEKFPRATTQPAWAQFSAKSCGRGVVVQAKALVHRMLSHPPATGAGPVFPLLRQLSGAGD